LAEDAGFEWRKSAWADGDGLVWHAVVAGVPALAFEMLFASSKTLFQLEPAPATSTLPLAQTKRAGSLRRVSIAGIGDAKDGVGNRCRRTSSP
jgi:hypothetical protein